MTQPPEQGKRKYSLHYKVADEYILMGVLADETTTTANSYHNSMTLYPHSGVGKKRKLPVPTRRCMFADSVRVTPFDMTAEPSSVRTSPSYHEPINGDNTSSPHSKAKNALLQKFKLERKMNRNQVAALLQTFMTEDMDRGEFSTKVVDALTLIHSMVDQNKQAQILLPNGCGTPITPPFQNAIRFLVSAVCEFGGLPDLILPKAPSPDAPLSKAPSPEAPL